MSDTPPESPGPVNVLTDLAVALEAYAPEVVLREVGAVISVSTGIALVSGLPGIGFEEVVTFAGGMQGIAFNVDEHAIGVVLLGDHQKLRAGDAVERGGRVIDIVVGEALLGRVLDPLGMALDGKGALPVAPRHAVERPAPPIMDRAAVDLPLQSGLTVIDALIPIGRGQRELILGDRQTGKTTIAIDTIINQRDKNVICVYCAIGQRTSAVAKVVAQLTARGAMEYTVVMVADGSAAAGLSYIAPYAATSIAEHFMESGRDVLIVYDDLTQHARAYRELSLLLRRPPGREAFPGDIFYLHSRLLERSTHLRDERGHGSLTALPIVETEAQDISAYIPTNLISITDGQVYLSPTLFELGVLPAVDVGKSVSRVGGAAQRPGYRAIAGALKLSYAQFEELETFAKFGTRLDAPTRAIIEHGRRIRSCLTQDQGAPQTMGEQMLVLLAVTEGMFAPVPLERMRQAQTALHDALVLLPKDLRQRFDSGARLTPDDRRALLAAADRSLEPFRPADSKPVVAAASTKSAPEPGLRSTRPRP
jgi:F-type H+-transporting ATPase subunit alpha